MDPRLIVLIIICSLVGLALIMDFFIMVLIIILKRRLSRRGTNVDSLMAQQYDLTMHLGKMLIDEGVKLTPDLMISLNLHEKSEMSCLSTSERLNVKTIISKTASSLLLLAETTSLKDLPDFKTLKHSLQEFNANYRHEGLLYNQDAYAYNYWIKFWTFLPFSMLFRLKKIDNVL